MCTRTIPPSKDVPQLSNSPELLKHQSFLLPLCVNPVAPFRFSQDSRTLLSRCADGTLKVWDLRKFSQPVHSFGDLPTNYPTTKAIFSPDEQIIATGEVHRDLCR